MSLGSTVLESSSRTLVDSALAGQPGRGLVVLDVGELGGEAAERPTKMTIQAARTIHLVTRPVSLPAI